MGLKDRPAFSGFAVPDLAAARAFYGQTLGLDIEDTPEGGIRIRLGSGANVFVYPKPDFVPASYTILNFEVADIDASVDELVAAGVRFEHYPGLGDEKGIARDPRGPMIAWFRDPAGNILAVLQNE